MPDSLETVNTAARLYRRWATEPDNNISEANKVFWAARADEMEAAAADIERLRAWAKPLPTTLGDLSDLPPELMTQLSGVKTDELEEQIYAVVKAAGDEIELDRILIELFRRHGTVHQRRFINNKLWRMGQRGLVHSIKGRKGVYTTHPQATPAEPEDFMDEEEAGAPSGQQTAPEPTDVPNPADGEVI